MAKTKKDYTNSVGRRKKAIARARVFKGDKESTVNGELIGKYFPGTVMRNIWNKPFVLTNTKGKYYVTVKVVGGGIKGQLDAVLHAISRSLVKIDEKNFKTPLKKAGLLIRDSRRRQRRMIGTGGKARRAKQSPKR